MVHGLPRLRRVIGDWRSTDFNGQPLWMHALSTQLTQSAMHRGTTCKVHDEAYLLRRIAGETEPLVKEADALDDQLVAAAQQLIARLHWRDMEILVDRIFNRGGWERVGQLGETQADADLVVEQCITNERALVQVKSRADAAELEHYLARFASWPDCSRLFFICHSPTKALRQRAASLPAGAVVWFGETLARKAVEAGLFGWLVQQVR